MMSNKANQELPINAGSKIGAVNFWDKFMQASIQDSPLLLSPQVKGCRTAETWSPSTLAPNTEINTFFTSAFTEVQPKNKDTGARNIQELCLKPGANNQVEGPLVQNYTVFYDPRDSNSGQELGAELFIPSGFVNSETGLWDDPISTMDQYCW